MRRVRIFLCDALGIIGALFLATAVRFDGAIPAEEIRLVAQVMPVIVAGKLVALYLFRCDRWSFRYAGLPELRAFFSALSLGTLLSWACTYIIGPMGVSRGALLLEPLFSIFLLGAYRFGFRVLPDFGPLATPATIGRRVLIIGAGDAGVMTLREIRKNPRSDMSVVGFIDDDAGKKGEWINGVRVIGGREEVPGAVESLKIDEIIIAIPSASGEIVRELVAACREVKTRFRVVPGLLSIIRGDVDYARIREIRPEDLLGRETIEILPEQFGDALRGRRVLVTGAGGSIGSELARQLLKAGAEVILLDHSEPAIYMIRAELENLGDIRSYIADIRNRSRLSLVLEKEKPEIVFHAAAYKHVPLMEENIDEAVSTNIIGTKNLFELAEQHGARRFVFISTDKAVRPTSVMGATKRAAEIWLLSRESGLAATAVRFGNVFGSSGSAPLLFRRQIESGGPVTVTHPHVVRFFMTIQEAVFLVIQASLQSRQKDLFVLEMGQPIRILDLARDMIILAGFRPDVDIKIVFTGMRPGEKLFEEVLTDGENIEPTPVSKVFRINRLDRPPDDFEKNLEAIEISATPRDLLKRLVEDYRPES